MTARPSRFRKIDLTRAIGAFTKCGLKVAKAEIDLDGKIVIVCAEAVEERAPSKLEAWKAQRDARQAQGR